ncbi:MAG: hypothetical protein JXI33_07010 [Candidatus Aminicenantes bacterium]|nr:hypothetical protein [Candidatus Aminicenantes bacterium]
MIKKKKKPTAVFVAMTFIWLMQLSTMPGAVVNGPEQVSTANSEPTPDFMEEEGGGASRAMKKSILPVILISVGILGIAAAIVFLLVLNKYNITGSWQMTFTWQGESPGTVTLTFTGDNKSGTFVSSSSSSGTYTVDGKNVGWTYSSGTKYSGTFSGKKSMSGTMVTPYALAGTWAATKNASAVSSGLQKAAAVKMDVDDEGK